ncbi:MAG: phosphotransferase [Bacilli bacterium]
MSTVEQAGLSISDFEIAYKKKLVHCERLIAGHTNLIYLLQDEVGGRLIARISVIRSAEELQYESKLHIYLSEHGIHCPRLVGTEYVYPIRDNESGIDYPSILMEFIDGIHPESTQDLIISGRELAKLHQIDVPSFARKRAGMNLDALKVLMYPSAFEHFISRSLLKEVVCNVENSVIKSPQVLCHGDLFRINALIHNQTLYFLDLESMGADAPLLDLGKALFGMVTPRTTIIDRVLADAFITGYADIRSITQADLERLPLAAAMAGIQIGIWRYEYWRSHPNHYDITEDLWKDALKTSLAWLKFYF